MHKGLDNERPRSINYESTTAFELESESAESEPLVKRPPSQLTSFPTSTSRKEHDNEFEMIDLSGMNQEERDIKFPGYFSSGVTQHGERNVLLKGSESENAESLV